MNKFILFSILFILGLVGLSFAGVSIVNQTLNSTSNTNTSLENLTCNFNLNDTATISAISWTLGGAQIMRLYYPFEGGSTNALNDYSGSGYTLSNIGGVVWNSTERNVNDSAFDFKGNASKYLISTDKVLMNISTNMTFCAWVKWYSYFGGAYQTMLEHGVHGSTRVNYIFAEANTNRLKFTYADGTFRDVIDTKFNATNNVWYYICYVVNKNAGNVSFYVNATLQSTIHDVNNLNYSATGGNLSVGINTAYGETFNGSISSEILYNKTLSVQEITALYNNKIDTMVSQELNNSQVWACLVTPFSASAVGSTYTSNSLTIIPAVSDSTYPLMFNFTDDNKSVIDSGIGNFYVQINNTNGTVNLEINNANYTATNTTRNNFNASFTFSYGKTYTYKWWAYGNGTSQLLNSSPIFNYGVNISCIINGTVSISNSNIDCSVFTINTNSNLILATSKYTYNDSVWQINSTVIITDSTTNFGKR